MYNSHRNLKGEVTIMKLNLCIDIDGTITDPYYWLDLANKHFQTNIKPSQVTKYDIHEVLKIPREDYLKFYEAHWEQIHGKADLREEVKQFLWKLEQQHNIFYVTAREARMKAVTEEWFRRNDLPQGQLHLLGSHYKVDKAKELNCHIFIEDRYENAIQLAEAGFQVLLIDCYYNRQPLIPGVTRVFDWRDIYKIIEEHNRSFEAILENAYKTIEKYKTGLNEGATKIA